MNRDTRTFFWGLIKLSFGTVLLGCTVWDWEWWALWTFQWKGVFDLGSFIVGCLVIWYAYEQIERTVGVKERSAV